VPQNQLVWLPLVAWWFEIPDNSDLAGAASQAIFRHGKFIPGSTQTTGTVNSDTIQMNIPR
jgi:hypothetical protein